MHNSSDCGYFPIEFCGDCGKPWHGAGCPGEFGCCFGFTSEKTVIAAEREYDTLTVHERTRGGWVRLAKNRINFRHDTRHGEEAISAILSHAVY